MAFRFLLPALLLVAVALPACSDSADADARPTSELAAFFRVRASEGQLSVTASVAAREGFTRLSDRDHFVATIQEKRVPLVIDSASKEPFYAAKDVAPSADATVSIVLERGSGATPTSTVVLPGDFAILEAPDAIAEGEEVTFRLSREPLEQPELSLTGECPAPFGSHWSPVRKDGAAYTYKIDSLHRSESGPCHLEARITLTREDGVVDPAFAREVENADGIGPVKSELHAERWTSKVISLVER